MDSHAKDQLAEAQMGGIGEQVMAEVGIRATSGESVSEKSGMTEFQLERVMQGMVPVSVACERLAKLAYSDFQSLLEILPGMTMQQKKQQILDYSLGSRRHFVKLYALIKWSQSAQDVSQYASIVNFLMKGSALFTSAVMGLWTTQQNLAYARVRNYDIPAAVDIFATGNYNLLPRSLEERYMPEQTVPVGRFTRISKDLEDILRLRMMALEDPPTDFETWQVMNGNVHFEVPGKFSVSLSLESVELFSPWRITQINVMLRVRKETVHLPGEQLASLASFIQKRMYGCTDAARQGHDHAWLTRFFGVARPDESNASELRESFDWPCRDLWRIHSMMTYVCLQLQLDHICLERTRSGRRANTTFERTSDTENLWNLEYWLDARPSTVTRYAPAILIGIFKSKDAVGHDAFQLQYLWYPNGRNASDEASESGDMEDIGDVQSLLTMILLKHSRRVLVDLKLNLEASSLSSFRNIELTSTEYQPESNQGSETKHPPLQMPILRVPYYLNCVVRLTVDVVSGRFVCIEDAEHVDWYRPEMCDRTRRSSFEKYKVFLDTINADPSKIAEALTSLGFMAMVDDLVFDASYMGLNSFYDNLTVHQGGFADHKGRPPALCLQFSDQPEFFLSMYLGSGGNFFEIARVVRGQSPTEEVPLATTSQRLVLSWESDALGNNILVDEFQNPFALKNDWTCRDFTAWLYPQDNTREINQIFSPDLPIFAGG